MICVKHTSFISHSCHLVPRKEICIALFPGLHAQLCRLQYKKRGKAWKDLCWRHVQSAHIWVCSLPLTLHSLSSVHCFCSVCPARPVATASIVACYSTWRQQMYWLCFSICSFITDSYSSCTKKGEVFRLILGGVRYPVILASYPGLPSFCCSVCVDTKVEQQWKRCSSASMYYCQRNL